MRLIELNKPKQIGNFQKDTEYYNNLPLRKFRPYWHDSAESPWNQIVNSFKMHGFKKLGYGNWGAVFKNPSYPYVIKVFLKDSGFTSWVQYAIANQNNPHVPPIKGRITKIKGTEFYFVRIGELEEFNDKFFKDSEHYKSFMENLDEYLASGDEVNFNKLIEIANINKIPINPDYFKSALDYIIQQMGSGLDSDLYYSNIMAKGRMPVITDPLFHMDES